MQNDLLWVYIHTYAIGLFILTSCATCKQTNTALQDLSFIRKTILENHPGVYNELDPRFRHNLLKAYRYAKAQIMHTSDAGKQKMAINEFVKSFNDNHLRVEWNDTSFINGNQKNTISPKFTIISFTKNISWITLPKFFLNSDQEKQMQKLLKEIPKAAHKDYIVFYLRGNSGGNSDYGSAVIDALFGKEYAAHKRCIANRDVYIDWRVSKGNAAYMEALSKQYKDSREWQEVASGLSQNLAEGKYFYRQYDGSLYCNVAKPGTNAEANRVTAKIIVIIDQGNASAALDFIDDIKMMAKDVTLIGKQTMADRLYMEVRTEQLPRGQGMFIFPIKVYRNRLRGDKEPYKPDIALVNMHDLKQVILGLHHINICDS